jgi:hypothetical protein
MEWGSSKWCAADATALLLLLPLLWLCCRPCCLYLRKGSSGGSMGVAVCRRRGGDFAATVFLLLHANEVMVSHLFPAVDIGVTALSVAMAIDLGAVIPWVEIKMMPMTMTMATTNETHHGTPSTPPYDPCPKDNKGKGNEGKVCGHCHNSCW